MDKTTNAASFDQAAEVYERSRPEYPEAAVDWLLPPDARVVLDLGAGTGKLTRSLTARGLEVVAIDPSPNMLSQLRTAVPGAVVHQGSAEDIPLADASVDAIVVAQAWHWVDQDAALPSVARVLRPGGTLGLVWNYRDERSPWIARLTEAMHPAAGEIFLDNEQILTGPFGPIESADFEWSMEFSREAILELLKSRSYYITSSPSRKEELETAVNDLLDNDPDVGGQTTFTMPYVTHAFRMRLPE